jgi:hypothetical protein
MGKKESVVTKWQRSGETHAAYKRGAQEKVLRGISKKDLPKLTDHLRDEAAEIAADEKYRAAVNCMESGALSKEAVKILDILIWAERQGGGAKDAREAVQTFLINEAERKQTFIKPQKAIADFVKSAQMKASFEK